MMGWYGLLAIEGMAERKAVVALPARRLSRDRPDLPVVSAEPGDTGRGAARAGPRIRRAAARLGERGLPRSRARTHDTRVVGERVLRVYRRDARPRPRRSGRGRRRPVPRRELPREGVLRPRSVRARAAGRGSRDRDRGLAARAAVADRRAGSRRRATTRPVVFAGEPAAAPPDPAAVIAVRDWPEWDLAALRTGRVRGRAAAVPARRAGTTCAASASCRNPGCVRSPG